MKKNLTTSLKLKILIDMKKFILFILLAISLGANAQKVKLSRMEQDGRWQIMTSEKKISLNGAEYSIILKAYVRNGVPDYCLLVSSFYTIPENAEVLFKLGNGETLYFPICNLKVGDISSSYVIGSVIVPNSRKHYISVYDITEHEIQEMEEFGILKMRVTGGSSYREKEWKKDKIGKFLGKSRQVIEEEMKKYVTKDIWDGF